MRIKKLLQFNHAITIGILILCATFITFLSFMLQPNDLHDVLNHIKSTPLVFIYNFIPVLLLIFFFYFLSDNLWVGIMIGSFIVSLLSIINRYKIIYRDDPLVPADIFVGNEAFTIMKKSKITIDFKYILLLVFIVIFSLLLIFLTKRKKLWLPIRISGLLLCLILAFVSNKEIYTSKTIYDNLPVQGNKFLISNVYNSKGFVYSFLYNLSAYTIDKPKGYEVKEVKKWIQSHTQPATNSIKTPHVIMIMGEAFTDISENKNLRFTEESDPLRFYKTLKSENLLNGYVITPAFGGGTANTEFDVLTGCITNNISETSTSAYRLVRNSFDALPRAFEKLDYSTLAIHPGYAWFYNRENVFNHFGFDNSIFQDAFSKTDLKGGYMSEEATIQRVIDEFDNHITSAPDNPFFEFCVTIQNHMPYVDYKYPDDNQPTFETDLNLSPEAKSYLANYFIGIKDADTGIETLVNYLKTLDEPVILVYFGDHLPNLGQDYLAYKEIGYNVNVNGSIEDQLNVFKTPFFIWGNASAKELVDVDALQMPTNDTISANYLGAMVMELIGQKDVSPFFSFVNATRKELPIITKYNYMLGNTYTSELTPEASETLDMYKKWQYYKMKDETIK